MGGGVAARHGTLKTRSDALVAIAAIIVANCSDFRKPPRFPENENQPAQRDSRTTPMREASSQTTAAGPDEVADDRRSDATRRGRMRPMPIVRYRPTTGTSGVSAISPSPADR